jgi:Icc-related predicted phosphoesterase
MKIELNDSEPIEKFTYKVVAQGGRDESGNRVLKEEDLPIYLGSIKNIKADDIDYLIIASDLQGNVIKNGDNQLLGEVLPEFLKLLFDIEFSNVNRNKIGVFLCGDFFARLDKRGGLGDVKNVWRAFNKHFGFVVGVAGNHDDFGDAQEFENFQQEEGIYYLHNQIKKVANLKIGGISGIIGRPDKPFRNEETKHLKELKKLLLKQPDFILLHEGPNNLIPKLQGNDKIRAIIEGSQKNVLCCGHNHWNHTLIEKKNGTQIINADSKCIILKISK